MTVVPMNAPPSTTIDENSCVLLMGAPGSGKSYALPTIIEAGLDLFVVGTERSYRESIEQSIYDRKLDINKFHYHHIYPATAPWDQLEQSAKLIGSASYETLSLMKSGVGKEKYQQFVDLYRIMANFIDERTGKQYGPVDKLDPTTSAVAIDSLTGVAMMSMDLMVGSKPTRHQGEWGVAMDNLERFGNKCTADIKCFFVMTGHVEREVNPITQQTNNVYVSTLGSKLSPKWGRFYSEVVHAYRENDQYYWSTITPLYDLKRRFLPLQDKMKPSFVPIIEAWRTRRKRAAQSEGTPA